MASDTCVFDTSTLQSLHRGGALAAMSKLYRKLLIPMAVADETRWSLQECGKELVPDIDAPVSGFDICAVGPDAPRLIMEELFLHLQRRQPHGKSRRMTPCPRPLQYQGRMVIGSGRHKLTHTVPDLEVVVLARQTGSVIIADDKKVIVAAADLDVPLLTTLEVLDRLVEKKLLTQDQRASAVRMIEETGYKPTKR